MLNHDVLERILTEEAGEFWSESIPPICLDCGYNLLHSVSDRCPECGMPFSYRELRKAIADVKSMLLVLRGMREGVVAGFRVGLIGLGLVFAGFLVKEAFGWRMADMGARVLAFFLGFAAIMLSLSATRIWRLPRWARPFVRPPVPFEQACIGGVAGVMTLAALWLLP